MAWPGCLEILTSWRGGVIVWIARCMLASLTHVSLGWGDIRFAVPIPICLPTVTSSQCLVSHPSRIGWLTSPSCFIRAAMPCGGGLEEGCLLCRDEMMCQAGIGGPKKPSQTHHKRTSHPAPLSSPRSERTSVTWRRTVDAGALAFDVCYCFGCCRGGPTATCFLLALWHDMTGHPQDHRKFLGGVAWTGSTRQPSPSDLEHPEDYVECQL